jgi:hypothetical protein
MGYEYYPKTTDEYLVWNVAKREWQGVVTSVGDGRWRSETHRIYNSRDEAADANASHDAPLAQEPIE